MAFTNGTSLASQPSLLTPDPKWASVETRRLCKKTPLTEDELTKSPFGKYLPSPRKTANQRKYGSTNGKRILRQKTTEILLNVFSVPSTPIPRAPSRYRESIPPQWMDPLNTGNA
ncbi:hypothetical protein KIN20_018365 [Parelaphostrongylus tenuis]|uniref:Uncharacterized protein n=1 Tax=Parelaphostrongylus tenuis TaxID=148309 RepID=A0AAD5MJ90_PARTN|nr:hypothetical protein KIN20_018365 [Parelaphostrongylus tenuis]